MNLSIFFSRQSGAWASAHLQPYRPIWHVDPVRASGRPHSRDVDCPHRALPREFALGLSWVMLRENRFCDEVPLSDLCVPAGAASHPADAVPHQSLQLAAPHHHRYHPAQLHQHAGDICSQHFGNLRHHRWEQHLFWRHPHNQNCQLSVKIPNHKWLAYQSYLTNSPCSMLQ